MRYLRRLRRDAIAAEDRGADLVDLGPAPVSFDEVRAFIAAQRAEGATIVGCSFCERHRPVHHPLPCPVCDTMCHP